MFMNRMPHGPSRWALLSLLGLVFLPLAAHAQSEAEAAAAAAAAQGGGSSPASSTASSAQRSAGTGFAAPDGFYGLKPGHGRVIQFEEAMGLTVKNSFDLRIASEQLFQTSLNIRKAWSTVLPRLTATAGYTFSWPKVELQTVSQGQLDAQAAGTRAQYEGQAQIYDAQAAAAAADGNYNTEYANRALASRLRAQEAAVTTGKAPDPIAINPVNVVTGGLNLSFPIFNGRAIPLLYNAYDGVRSAKASIERARTTALYMSALAYFSAVSARRLVGIAERQTKNLEEHLAVTRIRVEVGTLPPLALRRAESDLERSKASVRTAWNAYHSAVGGLGQTLGIDEDFDVAELPPVPTFEDNVTEDQLIAHAEDNRPDILSAKLSLAVAQRNRVDAIMRWMPTVAFNARAGATSNISGFQKDPITYSVGINASLPLYDGGDRYTAWRESGSQIRQAKLVLEQQRWKLSSAVRGNLREVRLRKDNLVNQRLALQLAEENAKDARTRFEVGAATQLEVLDAEQLVVSASLDLALAEIELQQARLALSYVVGAFDPGVQMNDQKVRSISPVVFAGMSVPGQENTAVAQQDDAAPARAPSVVPAGRAARPGMPMMRNVNLTPSATDLIRAGLTQGNESVWSSGP
jgi:outer membrane protein